MTDHIDQTMGDWQQRAITAEKQLQGMRLTIAALIGAAGGEITIPADEINRALLMKDMVVVDDGSLNRDVTYRLVRGQS